MKSKITNQKKNKNMITFAGVFVLSVVVLAVLAVVLPKGGVTGAASGITGLSERSYDAAKFAAAGQALSDQQKNVLYKQGYEQPDAYTVQGVSKAVAYQGAQATPRAVSAATQGTSAATARLAKQVALLQGQVAQLSAQVSMLCPGTPIQDSDGKLLGYMLGSKCRNAPQKGGGAYAAQPDGGADYRYAIPQIDS